MFCYNIRYNKMPKVPIDYANTFIYKLVNKEDYDNANVYIGSTTNFTKRKCEHKSGCMNVAGVKYNQKIYQFIRDNGGWDEWNMIEIEKYSCVSKNEANAREEYWRIHFNADLNSRKCFRLENRDKLIEYQREYYKKSKN